MAHLAQAMEELDPQASSTLDDKPSVAQSPNMLPIPLPPACGVKDKDDDTVSSTTYEESPPVPRRRKSRGNFEIVMKKLSRTKSLPSSKFVHFANKLEEIFTVDSCKFLKSEQKTLCWWSSSEKSKMMARHEKIVNRMERQKPCKENQTYRGLEAWTTEGTAMLDQVISRCVDAVLTEQDHQWFRGKDDFDRIATVSRSLSADCAKEADQRGKDDERDALIAIAEIWREDADGDDGSVGSAKSSKKRRSKLKINYEMLDNPSAKMLQKNAIAKKTNSAGAKQKSPESPKTSPKAKKKKLKKDINVGKAPSSLASKEESKEKKVAKEAQKQQKDEVEERASRQSNNAEMDKTPTPPTRGESLHESVSSSAMPSLESFTISESVTSSALPSLASFTMSESNDIPATVRTMHDSFSSIGDSVSIVSRKSCDPPGRKALPPIKETSPVCTRVRTKRPPRQSSETTEKESEKKEQTHSEKISISKKSSKKKKKRDENMLKSIIVPDKKLSSVTSISSEESSLGVTGIFDTESQRVEDFVRIASYITGDRYYRLRKYPSVFVGSEVVSALVEEGVAGTRKDAVDFGRRLQRELGLFRHVHDDHQFADNWYFYRFRVTVLSQYQHASFVTTHSSSVGTGPGSAA
ncbi:MAG: hypothetical protein SGILL_003119 [Bacillariaceae sp.]